MVVALLSFTLAAVVLVLLPGPDTLVVVRSLVRGGRTAGIRTSAGVLCGLMVWVIAAALGLSALLQASEIGYELLQIVGACYLIWIGVQSLRTLRRPPASDAAPTVATSPLDRLGSFGAGLLTDVLNPKIGILFVTFLPGFVPDNYPVMWTTIGLGLVYVLLTALYCAALVAASGTISNWMRAPRIRRRLEALTGSVLIAFGLRLAIES
ncbi:LysE family translocator [Nocardia jejuensis]|uniref:LysE family translocator n=1 Tax=Nocardia jejuensis TaxID=328049 RepID=UPI0008304976|nr:LysE family translocator [Nocardia jejuensis]